MRTIDHEELKHMMDQREDFRLVMALGEWAYQARRRRVTRSARRWNDSA
jgi:hypothetical protein